MTRPAPVNFRITFRLCNPARLAQLLSIATRSGTPFVPNACFVNEGSKLTRYQRLKVPHLV